jgi:hypothetical protein
VYETKYTGTFICQQVTNGGNAYNVQKYYISDNLQMHDPLTLLNQMTKSNEKLIAHSDLRWDQTSFLNKHNKLVSLAIGPTAFLENQLDWEVMEPGLSELAELHTNLCKTLEKLEQRLPGDLVKKITTKCQVKNLYGYLCKVHALNLAHKEI